MRPLRCISLASVVLTCLLPAAAWASPRPTSSAPPSKIERVLAVVELFDTPDAALAARALAGLDLTTTTPGLDLSKSAWSADAFFTQAEKLSADLEYDYFDPAAPGLPPTPLDQLVPGTRRYLIDVATQSGLICPVPTASFYDTWGAPRSGGRVHVGTDMIAEVGIPVLAVGDARIVRVDLVDEFVPGVERDLGGITVTYVTVWGDLFYNGHLSEVPEGIRPGVQVPAGSPIGFIGETGNAALSVPHLHIQWHPMAGLPQNPYPLLAAACR